MITVYYQYFEAKHLYPLYVASHLLVNGTTMSLATKKNPCQCFQKYGQLFLSKGNPSSKPLKLNFLSLFGLYQNSGTPHNEIQHQCDKHTHFEISNMNLVFGSSAVLCSLLGSNAFWE
jgi:hypothetical protein